MAASNFLVKYLWELKRLYWQRCWVKEVKGQWWGELRNMISVTSYGEINSHLCDFDLREVFQDLRVYRVKRGIAVDTRCVGWRTEPFITMESPVHSYWCLFVTHRDFDCELKGLVYGLNVRSLDVGARGTLKGWWGSWIRMSIINTLNFGHEGHFGTYSGNSYSGD